MLICTERVTLSLFELKNPCWQLRKANKVDSGLGNDAKLSHPSHSSGSSPSLSPVVGMEDLSPSPQTCFISLHVPSLGERAGRDANANNCYKGDGHSCIPQVRQSENIIGSVRGRSDWLMLDASFV